MDRDSALEKLDDMLLELARMSDWVSDTYGGCRAWDKLMTAREQVLLAHNMMDGLPDLMTVPPDFAKLRRADDRERAEDMRITERTR